MARALLLSIRFHDGRYHGRPEWPPSPARLFQALIAGVAKGEALALDDTNALTWLEALDPPVIVAPAARETTPFANFVPNNDLDAVGGDPRRIAEIRVPKLIKPLLFDARVALLYAWRYEQSDERDKLANTVRAMAKRLYQLGRGVDMAWAWGEIIDAEQLEERLREHGGPIFRPCDRGKGLVLACPFPGSLNSLIERHKRSGVRFRPIMVAAPTKKEPPRTKQAGQTFSQPPKPRFRQVAYNSPPRRFLFELRDAANASSFSPWPLTRSVQLVECVRDRAARLLELAFRSAGKDREAMHVAPVFGLRRDAKEADKAARIRIVPLPSIGAPHVTRSIRRVLVEAPANCCLPGKDIAWAFSGLDVIDGETGEIKTTLIPGDDDKMLRHYGIDEYGAGHRAWRTVTPAALPAQAARRRIDPGKLRGELTAARNNLATEFKEAKPGRERIQEEDRAASTVIQALRHVGVTARPEAIRVQREPFEGRGARAEAYAPCTRFAKERLWHVEIAFAGPVAGPLVIGDGRYLGLGVMAPFREALRDELVFAVPEATEIAAADGPALVRATRRALMALERDGMGKLTRLFSGHEGNGGPAASGRHEHIFIAADDNDGDGRIDRLIVVAPWACDRSLRPDRRMQSAFDDVVSRLATVRAGRLGAIALGPPRALSGRDPLIGPARVWQSRTPYLATRHAGRRKDPAKALERDLVSECLRRGLPRPEVDIVKFSAVPNGGGLVAHARLCFAVTVHGPLMLGRDSHQGGGLFVAAK